MLWKKPASLYLSRNGFEVTLLKRIAFWFSKWNPAYAHQCIDFGLAIITNEQPGDRIKHYLNCHKLIGKSKMQLEDEAA